MITKLNRMNMSICCEKLVKFYVISLPNVSEKSHLQHEKQTFDYDWPYQEPYSTLKMKFLGVRVSRIQAGPD